METRVRHPSGSNTYDARGWARHVAGRQHFLAFAFVGVAMLPTMVPGATWDVALDFGDTTNPSCNWSYGSAPSLGLFDLYTAFVWGAGGGSPVWLRMPGELASGPLVWRNLSGGPVVGLPHGAVGLHPGPFDMSIVRWTAPVGGSANIFGSFGAGDQGAVSVWVLHNGESLFNVNGTGAAQPFNLTRTLAIGDTLDFVVHNFNGISFDTTPLAATISVPIIPGDMNCDGMPNGADIQPFLLALSDPAGYASNYPLCDVNRGDMNTDTSVDIDDVPGFVAWLLAWNCH